MPEQQLRNATVLIASSMHDDTVTINQAAHAIDRDQKRRIAGLESLARAETRLICIGDPLLRIARRLRHPLR